MSDEYEEQKRIKQSIRETMEWKETGELIDIWLDQNTDEWTEEALQVVGEILRERGVDLQALGDEEHTADFATHPSLASSEQSTDSADEEINEAFNQKIELRSLGESYMDELEEKGTRELVWLFRTLLVRLQAIRQALADRGIDTEGYEESDLNLPAKTIKCTNCDASLPGDARYCPQCGLALYPEEENEEESS
jgi:predicted HTH domain antitoxin